MSNIAIGDTISGYEGIVKALNFGYHKTEGVEIPFIVFAENYRKLIDKAGGSALYLSTAIRLLQKKADLKNSSHLSDLYDIEQLPNTNKLLLIEKQS